MCRASERHDGHAHHERLACREPAAVRRRVERDVDVGVLLEVVGAVRPELDARGVDADFAKPFVCLVAAVRRARDFPFDDEA